MQNSSFKTWSNRWYSVLLLLCVFSTVASAAQNQQIQQKLAALEGIRGKFSFVVIGDNRSGDETYRAIVRMIMDRRPEFVVNTGDMIETPGKRKDWAKFWELSAPITVPYFLTVGNHDIHPKLPGSDKIYKEEVDQPGNELYYSFVAGNSLFIVLDSYLKDEEKKITGEQLKWLEALLAGSHHKHKFAFVHHPLYTDLGKGHHSHDSLDKYPETRDALQALFAKYNVYAVFAGHEHYYERRSVDKVLHIIAGGGGAPMYDREEYGGFFHFVLVTVDGDKVAAEVVDVNGKVRDRF